MASTYVRIVRFMLEQPSEINVQTYDNAINLEVYEKALMDLQLSPSI